jgi:hypothetical protein
MYGGVDIAGFRINPIVSKVQLTSEVYLVENDILIGKKYTEIGN